MIKVEHQIETDLKDEGNVELSLDIATKVFQIE